MSDFSIDLLASARTGAEPWAAPHGDFFRCSAAERVGSFCTGFVGVFSPGMVGRLSKCCCFV